MQRPTRRHPLTLMLLLTAACGDVTQGALAGSDAGARSDAEPDDSVGSTSSELRGDIHFASGTGCSPAMQDFVTESIFFGRVAAASNAVRECLTATVGGGLRVDAFAHDASERRVIAGAFGPYRACNDEPFFDEPAQEQLIRALRMIESPNDLEVLCSGSSGNASVANGDAHPWGHLRRERTSLGQWFENQLEVLSLDNVCTLESRATGTARNCRWDPYPWPYSQAAGTLWHEAAHTHSYSHGGNDQESGAEGCGYEDDPDWHYQLNTMPYIIGNCVQEVLGESGWHCGDVNSCGNGALRLVTTYGGDECECVAAMPGTARYPVRARIRGWGSSPEPLVTGIQSVCADCLPHPGDGVARTVATSTRLREGASVALDVDAGELDCTVSLPTTMPAGGFRRPLDVTCYDTATLVAVVF